MSRSSRGAHLRAYPLRYDFSMDADAIDVAGVARILGLTRSAVVDHVARSASSFPAAVTSSAAGPCWPAQAVYEWAACRPKIAIGAHPERLPPPGRLSSPVLQLVKLAGEEAASLNHGSVLPMHLLLGALSLDCPGAARGILRSFGVGADAMRDEYSASLGDPFEEVSGSIRFAPLTQVMLERSNVHAVALADEETDSEHVLLALLQYWESTKLTPQTLTHLRVDSLSVRNRILAMSLDGIAGFVAPQRDPPAREPTGVRGRETLWPETLKLRPTPEGRDPRRRRPWAEITAKDKNDPLGAEAREAVRYLVDRDGNPVLTTEGAHVTVLVDNQGQPVRDAAGTVAVGTVRAE